MLVLKKLGHDSPKQVKKTQGRREDEINCYYPFNSNMSLSNSTMLIHAFNKSRIDMSIMH